MNPTKGKFAVLVGDGMADEAVPELDNCTPLEYARTPNMDSVVSRGRLLRVRTVPEGMPPGSDVANMSLMGYDPAKYYRGRAPIEAAGLGIALGPDETAFRCNLVCLRNGIMADYSAGHIGTDDARELIGLLNDALGSDTVTFHPGVSYRHLLVLKEFPEGELVCTPPHDISGTAFDSYLPRGAGQELVREIMLSAREVLRPAAVNQRRIDRGTEPATDIWLWGQGTAVVLPTLHERFGISGSVISAVDLVRGIGTLAGLRVRMVRGATGYLDTNYAGKVEAARNALKDEQFVYLHVEAPDETSHEGSVEKKVRAIEDFDRYVVGEMLKLADTMDALRILVMPDHATLLSTRTHRGGDVPAAVCGRGVRSGGNETGYSESNAREKPLLDGVSLFERFIAGSFDG